MPFLLVTGYPSSGKSTITTRIVDYFREKGKEVVLIKDEDYNLFSRDSYNDATKEKEFRSFLRSQIQKHLTKNCIVICDGLNYIKGFRYELFLVAKLVKTTYAVVQVDGSEDACQWLNSQKEDPSERYSDEKICQLFMRYEKPDARQRWDSPLYHIQIGKLQGDMDLQSSDDMMIDLDRPSPRYVNVPLDEIYDWLIEGVALKENASTATAPLAPTNYLHELDRTTQEVVQCLVAAQRTALPGQDIVIPIAEDGKNKIKFTKLRSLPELSRLRRQYITFSKMHQIDKKSTIASLFIDYLNSNNR